MRNPWWKMRDPQWKMRDPWWKMRDPQWKMRDPQWKIRDPQWKIRDPWWKMRPPVKDERPPVKDERPWWKVSLTRDLVWMDLQYQGTCMIMDKTLMWSLRRTDVIQLWEFALFWKNLIWQVCMYKWEAARSEIQTLRFASVGEISKCMGQSFKLLAVHLLLRLVLVIFRNNAFQISSCWCGHRVYGMM